MSTVPTNFNSGRTDQGAAYVSDHEGSVHARFMRLTSYALAPLGVLAAWWIVGLAGKTLEGVRAEIGRPIPGDRADRLRRDRHDPRPTGHDGDHRGLCARPSR